MKTVTDYLNTSHLDSKSTLGQPSEIPVYGWPLVPSINFSTAYAFESIEKILSYHGDKYNSVRYARDSSVIVRQLEFYFSNFHGGRGALLFNSGMSALSACFNSLIVGNSRVMTVGIFYRKCNSILDNFGRRFGVSVENFYDVDALVDGVEDGSDVIVFLESPSNPFLRVVDVERVRREFPRARIILDITFQGLLNGPDNLSCVDYLVMSCTKYIGGHNDVLAGAVICRDDELYSRIWDERSMRGGIIDNFSAYMLLRSLRTYDLRMQRTLENTEKVLDFLAASDEVETIYYPGRYANSEQNEVFGRMLDHGGGVVTFQVKKDVTLESNLENLLSTKMAPSFGSVDSLIEIPFYMSYWGKRREDVLRLGLDERTVRFSVGNEPINYIEADLRRVLGKG